MFTDIWSLISLSELVLTAIPIYLFFKTNNLEHLIAFIGILSTAGLVEFIKMYILPNEHRPAGAKGCDLLCRSPNDSGKPGMPSGHSAISSFFGAYYDIRSPLYWAYVLLIGMSRFYKKCHTPPQIVAGIGVGLMTGRGFRNLRVFESA